MTLAHALILAAAILASGFVPVLLQRRWRGQALERALYPEVVGLRFQALAAAAEIARRHRSGEPLDEAFFQGWRLSTPLVYPAVGGELGFLSADVCDRIGHFHAQLADARARLAEIRAGRAAASPYRVLSNLLRASNHVETWVRALEPRRGPLLGGWPDAVVAHRLLEALEEEGAEQPLIVQPYVWPDVALPR